MAKKRKKSGESRAIDGNVVLFTALSMILLAFFIVLNSIAVVDHSKKLEAWGSLMGSFGILPGGILLNKGDTLLPYESPIVEEGAQFSDTKRTMEKYLVEYQLLEDVGFTYEGENIRISINTEFLFSSGGMELKPSNLPFLNLVTRLVGTAKGKVRVEGYSGQDEPGQNGLNMWDLSLLRSITVMEHMIEKGKISPARFSVGGYGTEKKINRRKGEGGSVDITIIGDVELNKSKEKEKGLYSYKGFIFDFREGNDNAGESRK